MPIALSALAPMEGMKPLAPMEGMKLGVRRKRFGWLPRPKVARSRCRPLAFPESRTA